MFDATDKQWDYIGALVREREMTLKEVEWLDAVIRTTAWDASQVIEWLLKLPKIPGRERELEPGVYQYQGEIWRVKQNRSKTHTYAEKFIENTQNTVFTQWYWSYVKGGLSRLAPEMRMKLDDAADVLHRYGRCLWCGRTLKAEKSLARMVGPVCAKRFA